MNHKLLTLLILLLYCLDAGAQVVADFTSSNTAACSPLIVSFTDISTGSPNTWSWNFGNGNTSSQQNPSAVYSVPGIYTVTLIASNAGSNDTMTKVNYVEVYGQPTPEFTSDITTGCFPMTVNFSNLTIPGSAAISLYTWDFGDGTSSNAVNPSHTYTVPGNYSVILIAADSNGCQDQITKNSYISVSSAPTAGFNSSGNVSCTVPQTVSFSNTSSGSSALNYTWFFGDGDSSTVSNPTHNYTNFGSYDVTLVVADAFGCSDTLIRSAHVILSDLNTDFTSDLTLACTGNPIVFTDTTTPATLLPQSWFWDFGDGNTSTLQNPTHAYAAPGNYTVTLQSSFGGCIDTETKTNHITVNSDPTANFSLTPNSSCSVPLNVNFTDLSTGAVSWLWDFGDGNSSVLQNPMHTYTAFGSFNVSLTIVNAAGCQDVMTINNAVQLQRPQALMGNMISTGCIPLTVNFTDSSISNEIITDWFWDFGDGNTSTAQNPSHTYTLEGTYTVSLMIENTAGCRDTLILIDEVQTGTIPPVDFIASPTTTCLYMNVSFTNLTGVGNAWVWDFGDGGTMMIENPSYQYADTGLYSVTLTVNNNGCIEDSTFTDYIYVSPPDALFTPVYNCTNTFEVTFSDNSIAPDLWIWDFGTGDSSFVQNPVYVFPDTGSYVVTLYVEDTVTGCSDVETQTIFITQPVADFSATNNIGCFSLTVNFNDLSTHAASWAWDFENGITSTAQNPTVTFNTPGVYDVTLTVTDIHGCTDTRIINDYVIVTGPRPAFTATPTTGCAPLTVDFTDMSTEFIGNIVSWSWFFGDGNTSSLQNPSNTYMSAGNYAVSLFVTDDLGCSHTATLSNFVRITFPNLNFTADTLVCPGSPVSFNNLSSGSGLSYQWDFGDGNSSTAPNPVHTYASTGTYTISLSATDLNGCSDTLVRTNYVRVEKPVAEFAADSNFSSCPPLFANFSDSSSGNIVSWLWNFGDGSSSNVQNPTKIYTSAGQFDVTLMVTSDIGCSDTITKTDYTNVQGPLGSFTFDPPIGCSVLPVTFMAATTNTATNTWDFGDGTVLVGGDTLTHNYSSTGSFYPSLILSDSSGCVVIVTSSDSISSGGQVLDFTESTNHLCIPDTVHFTDLSTSFPPFLTWEWHFGDGSSSTAQNPSHIYTIAGNFDVSLITDNGICRDTLTRNRIIAADPGPIAGFDMSDSVGCVPMTVNFTEQTLSDSLITGFSWDFGDGNTSTAANPNHTYTAIGTYDVILAVSSIAGCNDTVRRTVTVNALPNISTSPDTNICYEDTVRITASGGLSYEWTPSTGLSNTSSSSPLAFPSTTTAYQVLITDGNGCYAYDTVLVSIHLQAGMDAGTDHVICMGDSALVTATGTGTSFRWIPPTGLSADSILNPIATPTVTTNYLLTITDTNGCASADAMTVFVNTLPTFSAGNDTFVCGGNSISLRATGADSYSWSPSTFLNNANIFNPIATPLTNMTYEVTGTDTNGCIAVDTVNVQLVVPPDANAGPDQTICFGDSVQVFSSGGDPSDTYLWAPPLGISNTSEANPFLFPGMSTTYSLSITDTFGCSRTDDVMVDVNALPVVTLSPNDSICLGDTTSLSAAGGMSYTWNASPFLSCTNCPNPDAYPVASTDFIVQVTDTNACIVTDTLNIVVNPLPGGIITSDQTICVNQSFQIAASPGVSHSWTPASGLSCNNCPDPIANPGDTTEYFVTITDGNGCISTDSTTINVVQLPVPVLSANTAICEGENYQMVASGGLSYSWTPSNTLSCATCDTTMATPSASTVYTVEVSNGFGCVAYDSLSVVVYNNPVIDAGEDVNVCPGENVHINGYSDASNNFWLPTVFLNNALIVDPVATPIDTTVFILTSTNVNGCTSYDSMRINVLDRVQATVSSDTTICVGESVQLNAEILEASDIGANIVWRPDFFLDDANSLSPVATPLEDMSYQLIASSSTCIPDTQTVHINVNPLPAVNAGEDVVITYGASANLSATESSSYTYDWSPADNLSCPTCQNTDITLNATELVHVSVTDQNGCTASDSVTVSVIGDCGEDLVFVPNVFTPNNDNINDEVRVRTIGIDQINFFRVFDRWGKIIFETDDINEGWDGSMQGSSAGSGVYVYYISINCSDNTEITKQGNITLIR